MIKKLSTIFQSTSNKNILTLFSGNAGALLIQLAISPIIARIYSPKDLGVFAILFSTISILTTIINARYELAILLSKGQVGTFNVFFLSIIIASIMALGLTLMIMIWKVPIAIFLGDVNVARYLYFIPVITFLMGIYNPLKYYFTRHANYKILSLSQISKSLVQCGVQVGFGFLKITSIGLILGLFFSQLAGNTTLIKSFLKDLKTVPRKIISLRSLKHVFVKYKDYPMYSTWAVFLSAIATNITVFYIGSLYGTDNLGYYSFMQRYISAPLSLISVAIGQVFMQELSLKYRTNASGIKVFKQYIKKLFFLGVCVFLPIFFLIQPAVDIFFGPKWRVSADITRILSPMLLIQFIVIPLQLVGVVYQKQKTFLALQVVTFLVYLAPIVITKKHFLPMNDFFLLQMFAISSWSLVTIYFYYKMIVKHDNSKNNPYESSI